MVTDELIIIADLIVQQNFELIIEKDRCRLVYIMNDAAESFIVFENFKINGAYHPDCDELITAHAERSGDRTMLIIHQGADSVFTLVFDRAYTETFLYDYGKTGHFWIEGNEKLRIIDYWLGIIKDKYTVLGPDSCNDTEKELAELAYFRPLRFFNSVPEKYMSDSDFILHTTENSVEVMMKLAEETDNEQLKSILPRYSDRLLKKTAKMLASSECSYVADHIISVIREASSCYPERSHASGHADLYVKAEEQIRKLEDEGNSVLVFREEPFENTYDDMQFSIYLLAEKKSISGLKTSVVKIQ